MEYTNYLDAITPLAPFIQNVSLTVFHSSDSWLTLLFCSVYPFLREFGK